jgi:hypothetical protein
VELEVFDLGGQLDTFLQQETSEHLFLLLYDQCINVMWTKRVDSVPVLRIRMLLGLTDPNPDPLVRGIDPDADPDPSINKQK